MIPALGRQSRFAWDEETRCFRLALNAGLSVFDSGAVVMLYRSLGSLYRAQAPPSLSMSATPGSWMLVPSIPRPAAHLPAFTADATEEAEHSNAIETVSDSASRLRGVEAVSLVKKTDPG